MRYLGEKEFVILVITPMIYYGTSLILSIQPFNALVTKGCYLMISLASYNVICPIVKFKPIYSVNLTIMFVKSFIGIEDLVPRNSF